VNATFLRPHNTTSVIPILEGAGIIIFLLSYAARFRKMMSKISSQAAKAAKKAAEYEEQKV